MAGNLGACCQAAGLVSGFEEQDIKVGASFLTNGLMVEMYDYGKAKNMNPTDIGKMILRVLRPSVHVS